MLFKAKRRLRAAWYRARYRGVELGKGCVLLGPVKIAAGTCLGHSCIVHRAEILPKVVAGSLCTIEPGVTVGFSTLGDNVRIQAKSRVFNCEFEGPCTVQLGCELDQVQLGAYSYVARDAVLNQVEIGRFCSIGPRVIMGAGDHPTDLISTSPVFYSDRRQCGVTFSNENLIHERRRITLGNDVWIGANVFVRDGVRIGDGAIVAAGAIVTKDVPPYAIVGGVPARVIRYRFSDATIQAIQESRWWCWSEAKLRAAQPMIAQRDSDAFVEWIGAGAPCV